MTVKIKTIFVIGVLGVLSALLFISLGKKRYVSSGVRIENFSAFDNQGGYFELYRKRYLKGVVLIGHGCGCPVMRKEIANIEELNARFAKSGIGFYLVNAEPQDSIAQINEEAKTFGVNIPILFDNAQIVVKSLGLSRTAEAIFIDTRDWSVIYKGAMDDQFSSAGDRPKALHPYLADAIDSFLHDREPEVRKTIAAAGCAFSLESRAYTYNQDVKPILEKRCLTCHYSGGAAPSNMGSYQEARGWAAMIREVIRTNTMPPGQVDPNFGNNPKSNLPPEERAALVNWVDGGMPEGTPIANPPRKIKQRNFSALEKMDLKFEVKDPIEVPPTGEFDWALYAISEPLKEDLLVRAFQLLIPDPNLVHHAHVLILPDELAEGLSTGINNTQSLAKTYAVRTGNMFGIRSNSPIQTPVRFPENMVVLIPKGSRVMMDVHHNPTGKWEKFKIGAGLELAKCGQKYTRLKYGVLYVRNFTIPPDDPDYYLRSGKIINQDIVIHTVNFHMHKRGKAIRVSIKMPDGTILPLVSVPNFIYGKEDSYVIKPTLRAPKGSKLILESHYDNSSANPINPDPHQPVPEGINVDTREMSKVTYLYTLEGEEPYSQPCTGAPTK